jgi:tRNA dimethylallyltransferase
VVKKNKELIVICGPTGVGKTHLAVELALEFSGEIVHADSRQVYRGMDIGTAKPVRAELAAVPHHMLDVADPDEAYNAGKYSRQASKIIERLLDTGKTPIVEGGTGLYIRALTDGLFEGPGADYQHRSQLEEEADREGLDVLYQRLKHLDPETAQRLAPADRMRIIRALEVVEGTGKPISAWQKETPCPSYDCLRIGLNAPRAVLYERIEQRVDCMIERGLVDEVKGLLERGYTEELNSMQGLGYKQVVFYLKNRISLDETIALIKRDTRRFAKRQLTWFRKDDRIHWFSYPFNLKDIKELLTASGHTRYAEEKNRKI